MVSLTLLDPAYFEPGAGAGGMHMDAQEWVDMKVLAQIFNFKPSLGVSVTWFPRYSYLK